MPAAKRPAAARSARTPSGRTAGRPGRAAAEGPAYNKDGGVEFGDTGIWVGDYTIQPENGGLASSPTSTATTSVSPTTTTPPAAGQRRRLVVADGPEPRAAATATQGIGTRASDLGAWDKLQLGWLDYEIVRRPPEATLNLGPHEYNSAKARPPRGAAQEAGHHTLAAPFAGAKTWWSGTGDDHDNTMTRTVTLRPARRR